MIALYRGFRSLAPPDRRLLIEAALLMAVVWTGLHVVRFARLRRLLDRCPSVRGREADPRAVGRVRRAIAAVASRCPRATCLVQALAADAMLRRRGIRCELRIGVRVSRPAPLPLEAHAWVEWDGTVAVGAIEDLPHFRALTSGRRSA